MKLCHRKNSLLIILTGESARWSLCSNAKNNPDIKHYLEQTYKKVPLDIQAHLKETLESVPEVVIEKMHAIARRFKEKMKAGK